MPKRKVSNGSVSARKQPKKETKEDKEKEEIQVETPPAQETPQTKDIKESILTFFIHCLSPVFSFLPASSLAICTQVNKMWRNEGKSNLFWKKLFCEKYLAAAIKRDKEVKQARANYAKWKGIKKEEEKDEKEETTAEIKKRVLEEEFNIKEDAGTVDWHSHYVNLAIQDKYILKTLYPRLGVAHVSSSSAAKCMLCKYAILKGSLRRVVSLAKRQSNCYIHIACDCVYANKDYVVFSAYYLDTCTQGTLNEVSEWLRQGKPLGKVPEVLGINLEGVKLGIPKKLTIHRYDQDKEYFISGEGKIDEKK